VSSAASIATKVPCACVRREIVITLIAIVITQVAAA